MENISKKIRKNNYKNFEFILNNGLASLEELFSVETMETYLLQTSDNPMAKILIDMKLAIGYSDLYKILMHKKAEGTLNYEERGLLTIASTITDFGDLNAEISVNPEFLKNIIKAMYTFESMSGLGKINLVKNLSAYDNNQLSEINPLHQEDLNNYNKKITLDMCYKFFNNLCKKLSQDSDDNPFMTDNVIEEISGFLRKLSIYDRENYDELIMELLITDYKWSKYTISKEVDKNALGRIEQFEKFNENILSQLSIELVDYLNDILESYFNYRRAIDNSELTEVTEDQIDEYFSKNIKPKIKEKIEKMR